MQTGSFRIAALSLALAFAVSLSTHASAFRFAATGEELELGADETLQEPYDGPLDAAPVPGKDGLGQPPSATPYKEDREDLLGAPAFVDPAARKRALAGLYEKLKAAPDAKAALPITEAIEQAWRASGSDTVDLLMTRVDTLVLSAQLDLASDVLDAVTDIAPDDAEAWRQRALVSFLQKDNRRAVAELRRALSLDPRHYKAMRDLGMVLEEIGDKNGALEMHRQALEANPFLERPKQDGDEPKPDAEGQDI